MIHKQQHSIELIEDCLDRIYRSRKANLISKSRKFKEKQSRKFYDKYNNDLNQGKKYEYEEEEYNLAAEYINDGEVLEELSTKFKAPPMKTIPYEKERSRIAIEYEEQDILAETALEEFTIEIKEIINQHSLRFTDEEFRAEICDDLIDKFLTTKLDRCIGTRIVSKIRKTISVIIEYIASTDNTKELKLLIDQELNPSKSSSAYHIKSLSNDKETNPIIDHTTSTKSMIYNNPTDENKDNKTIDIDKNNKNSSQSGKSMSDKKENDTTNTNNYSKNNKVNVINNHDNKPHLNDKCIHKTNQNDIKSELSKEERQQIEKKRIKTQYEQLMNLKKKSENHPDDETIHQYQSLHTDIQNVIDSIKTNKPLK